jgi:hypothetical protein
MMPARAVATALLATALAAAGAGCPAPPRVSLTGTWPEAPPVASEYAAITERWTRRGALRGDYQAALEIAATLKSPEWRAARAALDADARGLTGPARDQVLAQARADAAGPYELQLVVVTWDRRENDLDRGARSAWRVRLLDESGAEIAPLEIVRDKRPPLVIRGEFPAFGDFATAYVARFPRAQPVLGPGVKRVRLQVSGARGGVGVVWLAP